MLRRILVLLGETPSSLSARQYALRLAQGVQAEVAGFAGIDSLYIERPCLGERAERPTKPGCGRV